MSTYKLRIPFTPKAKGSWRLGKYGQYNPSARGMNKTREFVKQALQGRSLPLMKGPLLVIVHYRIPAPSTITYKKRCLYHCLPHAKRPDGDNLEKFLNDALNGVLWDDDSRIAWLVRSKSMVNSKEGETVIFVRQLENNLPDYDLILSDIVDNIKLEEPNAA